jgi:predicted Zn-dependent peptidase
LTAASRSETELFHETLGNGLQVLGQHIPGVESASAIFWVKTGGRDESPAESGVSHFLEHMAFKRSKTRTYVEFNREFEEIGAENNAFTSVEMTAYHARVLGDQLPRCLELLADLTRPMLDSTDFEEERRVILEEIARHRDQPYSLLFDEFMRAFYPTKKVGQPTLGTPESIGAMALSDMQAYWQRRYGANNMLFSVAGNFDWEIVLDQVAELTKDWHHVDAPPRVSDDGTSGGDRVVCDDKWNQQHIIVGMPSISRDDPDYYTGSVLANILGDSSGSRLFWALNQTGLADQVGADIMTFSDTGVMLAIVVTDPDKASRALDVLQAELHRLQEGEIEPEEMERARMKLLTETVLEGESTGARMMGLVDSWLAHRRLETLDEVKAAIDSVTAEDVKRLLDRYPLTTNQVLTALGPLDASQLTSA